MPEALRDHAVNNIRFIRDTMERAGSFTSIPGWGGLAVGVTALATAAVAQPYTSLRPVQWLSIWLGCAVIASGIGWTTMVLKGKRSGVSLTNSVARRFFAAYFAPMIAGAAVTYALWRDDSYRAMPALWLLLYGAAFVSSGAFSLRVIPVMGACFMALGVVAAFLPLAFANLLLGAGFGGLHIIFGIVIARNYGG
jgi:hypothetical protein